MRRKQLALAPLLAVALLMTACSSAGSSSEDDAGSSPASSQSEDVSAGDTGSDGEPTATADNGAGCEAVDEKINEITSGKALSEGIDGLAPVAASEVPDLTDDQVAEIKAKNATAAIVIQLGGNDWANAQIAGATAEFERLGIEVVATTDAQGDAAKQVSDIETVLVKNPDVVLGIPLDPVATSDSFKKVTAQGAKLVFMDNPAADMTPGEDYVSYVSADNYANGVLAAHLLARGIDCTGKIGSLRYTDPANIAVLQRYQGFKATIESDYPDIELVADRDIGAPDFAGNAEAETSAMLTRYPDLAGVWAFFDIPAEGVVAAAEAAGRPDLVVTTCDLGLNIAVLIAQGHMAYGTGSQRPYDQGVMEARIAAGALIGVEAPPYVVLPALAVDASNVGQAWTDVYHSDPPAKLAEAIG